MQLPPPNAIPVDVSTTPYCQLRLLCPPQLPPRLPLPVIPGDDFHSHCQRLDKWQAELLCEVTLEVPLAEVSSKLEQGFRTASDGAVLGQTASFGWVVADQSGVPWAMGAGPVSGYQPTSYRAEAYGILAVLCFLKQVSTLVGFSTRLCFSHYCDNTSVILHCGKDQLAADRTKADWDVLSQLTVEISTMTIDMIHVKSHQDRNVALDANSYTSSVKLHRRSAGGRIQSPHVRPEQTRESVPGGKDRSSQRCR